MASVQAILTRMREALSLSDPEWDVSVGTLEYKILESVAVELASVYSAGIISDYHFDVETKSGVYLDRFVELFGVSRLLARRASGTVVFSTGTAAVENIYIEPGTQVYKPASSTTPAVYFQTVTQGVILQGTTTVEVPVECSVGGTIGNVIANSVIAFATNIPSVTQVTNQNSLTGGKEVENDQQLKERWLKSSFRSIAGTMDSYTELALRDTNVSKALVVGTGVRVLEELQVPSPSLAVTSTAPDIKYVYPAGSEYVGFALGTSSEDIGLRNTDYTFSGGGSTAVFTTIAGAKFDVGDIIQVEFDFVPTCSRNSPASGINNRVDIFVQGSSSESVTLAVKMDTSIAFSTSAYPLRTEFIRTTGVNPTTSNVFMPLMLAPLVTLPSTITVGGTTYTKNTHYWQVRDISNLYGSTQARDGIEWSSTRPTDGAMVSIPYVYNRLVRTLQDSIDSVRPVGVDLLVHQCKQVDLEICLTVVYDVGILNTSVETDIETVLSEWLSSKDFAGNIQISDLLEQVRNVQGIDNVRLTTSSDNGSIYGIRKLNESGSVNTTYTTDVYLKRDELPSLANVVVLQRAQNTF